jgi:hypothetical protein
VIVRDVLGRLRPRRPQAPVRLDPHDPCLVVLVEAWDPARADSQVLDEARVRGVDLSRPLLVRHHLVALPDDAAVDRARALLTPDAYDVLPLPAGGTVAERPPLAVLAVRTQLLTPLGLSQERSRMAGLAQRLGGDVAGWDALGPSR